MSFAAPAALFWLALSLPIAALYLMRVRVRQVPVGTDQFWEQVASEQRYRSAFRRLRDPLSLLAQGLLLATVAAALAEPVLPGEVSDARRLVLVLDNSATMNATDAEPTRLDAARREARHLIGGLRGRDEAALVAAGTHPAVVWGLTDDRRALERAVDAVAATDGPRRLPEALALARRLLAGHPRGQIVVLTDLAGDAAPALAGVADVRLVAVGRRADNLGVTRFQVRRSLRDLTGYELLIEVANCGDAPADGWLTVELDGVLVDKLPVQVEANATWRQVLERTATEGGTLSARLEPADALPADNHAWAELPACEPLGVTLVSRGNRFGDLFVEKVLEANPLVRPPLEVVPDPARVTGGAAVSVYHRRAPKELPPGAAFVVDPAEDSDLWAAGAVVDHPVATVSERDHPILAAVSFDNLVLGRPRALAWKKPPQVLAAAATGEPVLAVLDRPEGRIVVLAAGLDEAELPLRTAFPILAGNVLRWLARRGDDLRESVPAGATAEVPLPGPASGLWLWPPAGRPPRRLPDGSDRLTVGPLDRCGVWRLAADEAGPAAAAVVCNPPGRRDSDLRPAPAEGLEPPDPVGVGGVPLWVILGAAALLLFAAEWVLYQRRWLG